MGNLLKFWFIYNLSTFLGWDGTDEGEGGLRVFFVQGVPDRGYDNRSSEGLKP